MARHRSGPIPAGSPEVIDEPRTKRAEIRRRSHPVFHEGFIAQATQPQFGLFFGLGLAQFGERALTLQVVGRVVLTAAEQLHDVPAVLES